jgi:stage II sporulation protein D
VFWYSRKPAARLAFLFYCPHSSHIHKPKHVQGGEKMLRFISTVLISCLVVLILVPAVLVRGFNWKEEQKLTYAGQGTVDVKINGKTQRLPIEEYVKGVVAAEMPADFDIEALKAQAVAARTYALYQQERKGELTVDFQTDQAWLSKEELRRRWGLFQSFRLWRKVSQAVEETKGEVLVWGGKPIFAAYHSTCGGHTEDAKVVWGNSLPYLKSVTCKYCKESPRYRQELDFSAHDLAVATGTDLSAQTVSTGSGALAITKKSSAGRVERVRVGERELKGTDFRKMLGLRSTNFTIKKQGTRIKLIVVGNGHGVGMCQYGCQGLVKEGKDYQRILAHYYQGAKLAAEE